jgi:hypothetical protein
MNNYIITKIKNKIYILIKIWKITKLKYRMVY